IACEAVMPIRPRPRTKADAARVFFIASSFKCAAMRRFRKSGQLDSHGCSPVPPVTVMPVPVPVMMPPAPVMAVMPAPMTVMPSVVMAVAPVHLFRLQLIDLRARGHGRTDVLLAALLAGAGD